MTLRTDDFDYELPEQLIATRPAERRDQSKLMVLDRSGGAPGHEVFAHLPKLLPPRSLLVLNDTMVLQARLRGRKPSGGAVELLLVRRRDQANEPAAAGERDSAPMSFVETWDALARGLGKVRVGTRISVGPGVWAELLEHGERGVVLVRLEGSGRGLLSLLPSIGEIPLPPYIESARRRQPVTCDDSTRYQTVYAAVPGAVAAPTAGLHFTPELLAALSAAGHELVRLTLHVGPGTFRPVESDDPREHLMDEEHYHVPQPTVEAVLRAQREGRAVVAVGTTVARTLEAVARSGWRAGAGATRLFLLPGEEFKAVTHLVTNFHLPRSTLLMLVSALAGHQRIMAAYREAVAAGYRFYSYGDAMLVARAGDRS